MKEQGSTRIVEAMERTKSTTMGWAVKKERLVSITNGATQLNKRWKYQEGISMINQLNESRSNERKFFRVRANGVGRSGISTYFKFGIILVAALMALVV